MGFCRSSLATRPNLVMRSSNVISDERGQRTIHSLRSLELISSIVFRSGGLSNLSAWNTQDRRVQLIVFLLVKCVIHIIVSVHGVADFFVLEAHCVIRCLILIINTNVEMGL
jgi:predicted phosphatase